jgi:hypothetical protein
MKNYDELAPSKSLSRCEPASTIFKFGYFYVLDIRLWFPFPILFFTVDAAPSTFINCNYKTPILLIWQQKANK